jgi:hypothetical protein
VVKLDETMQPEEPRLLRSAFDLVLNEGAQTPEGRGCRWRLRE